MRKEPRDGGGFTPQVISDVLRDEAALVHVAGDALLVGGHARSRRHCGTLSNSTEKHNTKTVQNISTTFNEQQDATKIKIRRLTE